MPGSAITSANSLRRAAHDDQGKAVVRARHDPRVKPPAPAINLELPMQQPPEFRPRSLSPHLRVLGSFSAGDERLQHRVQLVPDLFDIGGAGPRFGVADVAVRRDRTVAGVTARAPSASDALSASFSMSRLGYQGAFSGSRGSRRTSSRVRTTGNRFGRFARITHSIRFNGRSNTCSYRNRIAHGAWLCVLALTFPLKVPSAQGHQTFASASDTHPRKELPRCRTAGVSRPGSSKQPTGLGRRLDRQFPSGSRMSRRRDRLWHRDIQGAAPVPPLVPADRPLSAPRRRARGGAFGAARAPQANEK